MESWIYGSGGKGFALCDEMLSHADVHIRTGEVLTGLDLKNICNHESSIQVPNQDVAVNQGLMQLAFSENVGKTISNDSFDGLGGGKIGNQKEFFGEEDIGSKDWNPATYYCGQDSSLIDLKLGSSTDCTDARNSRDSKDTRFFSSFASPIPAKRIRSTISHGQTPFCLVYGCDIDLTSSKDYYKRHKVCEVHSKTAKVIVNGIEQRFCQQCSRFHLLAEFDDGKRSCRKRLAGHNERRRKPQLDIQSGRNGRLFQSYHGILMGTILPGQPSFFCPDIIPSSINGEVKYEDSKWYQRIKLGVETMYSNAQPPVSVMKGQLFPKSFLSSHGAEQQFVLAHGINTLSGNICYENSNQYEQGFSTSSSLYDNESTIDSLSGVSDSGALSLLSSQSQNSSTYSLGIPITQPQVIQGKPHHSMGHISEKLLASRLQTSNKVSSSGLNLVEDDRMGLLVSDASNIVEYETDGTFEFMNTKAHLYHEDEHTVNLLQLSSLLHSAEQRRQSVQLKQDCKVISSLPVT